MKSMEYITPSKRNWIGTFGLMSGDLSFNSRSWYMHVLSVFFVPRTIPDTRESMRYQNVY